MVVNTGVTFAVQAVEIGANQEPIPVGDATFVTCGPFECAMGMDAPELSIANSAMCTAWDPTVEIQVGKVDNDVLGPAADDADTIAADGVEHANDGIDLGIVTSSSLKMNVKHVFSGVASGTNTDKTVEAARATTRLSPWPRSPRSIVDRGRPTPTPPVSTKRTCAITATTTERGAFFQARRAASG